MNVATSSDIVWRSTSCNDVRVFGIVLHEGAIDKERRPTQQSLITLAKSVLLQDHSAVMFNAYHGRTTHA
jgi:hypothetical protein